MKSQKIADRQDNQTGWSSLFSKLDEFRTLEAGWNGYAAPAPLPQAIDNARHFLQTLQVHEVPPTRIAPSAMGGVGVTCRQDKAKVYVEFYNDGTAHVLFSTQSLPGEMATAPLATIEEGFEDLVGKIRTYFDGQHSG